MISPILCRTAAEIAALALFETFPNVQIWEARETSTGFVCDAFFPHPIHPELHFQIEEKMRQIVREKREIRSMEMVPFSAAELLRAKGHKARAQELQGQKGLVQIVQIGSFIDWREGEFLGNTGDLAAFKVFSAIAMEDRGIRLLGTAASSKEELRDFLKKWASYPTRRHEVQGETLGFWTLVDGHRVWLAPGLQERKGLLQVFEKHLGHDAIAIEAPSGIDRKKMYADLQKKTGKGPFFEVRTLKTEPFEEVGLFDSETKTVLEILSSLEEINSLLQSIGKTLTILGFERSIRLRVPRKKGARLAVLARALEDLQWPFETVEGDLPQVEFLVADGLGRLWSAVTLVAEGTLLTQVELERNLGLLLERQEKGYRRLENQ